MPTFGIHRVLFDGEATPPIERGVLSERTTLAVGDRVKVEDRRSSSKVKRSAATNVWLICEITLVAGNVIHVKRIPE